MPWKGVERSGGRNGAGRASERARERACEEVDHEKREFSPTDAQGNRMRGRRGEGGREGGREGGGGDDEDHAKNNLGRRGRCGCV